MNHIFSLFFCCLFLHAQCLAKPASAETSIKTKISGSKGTLLPIITKAQEILKTFLLNISIIFIPGSGERLTKYGCEGTTLQIECAEGTAINLVRANYGRFSISICNAAGVTDWSVNCMEPRTLRVINARYNHHFFFTIALNLPSKGIVGDLMNSLSNWSISLLLRYEHSSRRGLTSLK